MATVRPARTSARGPGGACRAACGLCPDARTRDGLTAGTATRSLSALRGVGRGDRAVRPGVRTGPGERPDDAPPAQRKWMGEHPRWPSSSCVAAHFGSWSKALQAAGLSARCLTFEDSVADRVEEAWRLATAGHTIREIANQLGVSVSSVHNYLRARTCPECGGPVPSPLRRALHRLHRSRCRRSRVRGLGRPCATRSAPGPTSTAARRAITNGPRRARDPAGGRPRARAGRARRWSATSIATIRIRGTRRWRRRARSIRFRRWSDDAIRVGARRLLDAHRPSADGRRPAGTPDWHGPTASTLRRRYGSVERAWQALGPVPA